MSSSLDCLVIGAGPAGLTAAIYLARFHLSVRVIDAGHSRAALIPRTRNHAGFPGGISGRDLLQRMRQQAEEFGTSLTTGVVEKLERSGDGFTIHSADGTMQALTVLLATGVVNKRPPIAPEFHDLALSRGLPRYCPICDGYEVTDQQVGGAVERGVHLGAPHYGGVALQGSALQWERVAEERRDGPARSPNKERHGRVLRVRASRHGQSTANSKSGFIPRTCDPSAFRPPAQTTPVRAGQLLWL